MGQRLDLHAILQGITANVYFLADTNTQLQYPCIVYKRDDVQIQHADNRPYFAKKRYQVTVIDRNPDSELPDKVAALPTAAFSRNFQSGYLSHDVYTLYF